MKRRRLLIPAISLAFLLPLGAAGLCRNVQAASANSAPAYWAGSTGTGPIVTGGQCPVEVEHETLTLHIPRLPELSYPTQEEFEKYDASVSAEYTFYNPTDMTVKMDLLFPFGSRPEYANAGYDEEKGTLYFDDTARYEITADGEAVDRAVRYTYQGRNFAVSDMYGVADEKREDDFYSPALTVTKYSYTAEFTKREKSGYAEFVFRYNPGKTRILSTHVYSSQVINGDLHMYMFANTYRNSVLEFAIVGEEPTLLSAVVKRDDYRYDMENLDEVDGATLQETGKEQTTFEEYIEAARPEESGIGEVDFYNATLDRLVHFSYDRDGLVSFSPAWMTADVFMRWYAYSLEIPAGGRVKNRVTAPLYPTISHQACEYEYLLSPAQKWASFGTLEIIIDTELEIQRGSLKFTKTETGYVHTRESLPLGELTFEIGGDYQYTGNHAWEIFGIVVLVIFCLCLFLVIAEKVAGIILAIVLGVKFSRKRKEEHPRE